MMFMTALWRTRCIGSPVNCATIFTLGKAAELCNMHDRLCEHLRFANNPIAPSYNEEAMAVSGILSTSL